jgi:DNA polymerase III subunit gamma/tau
MTPQTERYIPLALKFRPKKFEDLKGQDVLVQTLSSAVINSRISTAYLLTGIRGVGKTTSARIIASVINCEKPKINGIDIEACGECNNCKSITTGNHPDIIEIDAASRTGVEDIRIIIDSAEYRPLLGRYKIFIIDEVHMISKNAFNALLKTLEEPPANILFIFATTEVNKIPTTILSRCQRFDLRRLATTEITKLLTRIADAEKIAYDQNALTLVALKSGGSARDAISMLDQASMLSFTHHDAKITLGLVESMLGIAGLDRVVHFVSEILSQNTSSALEIVKSVTDRGGDLVYFFENTLETIGYLTKSATIKDYKDQEYAPYHVKLEAFSAISLGTLTVLWQIFTKGIIELKTSHNQFLSAEMMTVRAIYASLLPTPEQALAQISNKEYPRR